MARADPAPFEIELNGEEKGTFFVEITPEGGFLLSNEDHAAIGLPTPGGPGTEIGGVRHFPLAGRDRVVELDESTLTLHIDVAADLLPGTTIRLGHRRPEDIYQPEERSLLFNYGLSVSGADGTLVQRVDLTHDLSAREGPAHLITDGVLSYTGDGTEYVRLMSRVVWDDRVSLRQMTAGDFFARSGPLGSQVLLGGVNVARNLDLDPYLITYPTLELQGAAALPSEVDVYVDGVLVHRERISPGPFTLLNPSRFEGAGDIEVVIRDAFGREERIRQPFYMAEQLLDRGTQEYSYDLGMIRREFGAESFSYAEGALSAFHRYGVSDQVTVGMAAEATTAFVNLSPRLSWKFRSYGTFDLSVAGSTGTEANRGWAAGLEYRYLNRFLTWGLRLNGFTARYGRLQNTLEDDRPKFEGRIRIALFVPKLGSLALMQETNWFHVGDDREVTTISYGGRIARDLTLYAHLRHYDKDTPETVFQLDLLYYPSRRVQTSARYHESGTARAVTLGVKDDPPLGQGYGYWADLNWAQTADEHALSFSPGGQWNNPYTIVRGDLDISYADDKVVPAYRASVSGALSWAGRRPRVSRPIRDSFAVVKVGDLRGVRVMRNSEVIGATDRRGEILVPELTSFYDNHVSVKDEDVPIEFALSSMEQYISPPRRGVACVVFNAARIHPVIGRFAVRNGDTMESLDFRPFTVRVGETALRTQTGYEGEFYIDISEADARQSVQLGCRHLVEGSLAGVQDVLTIEVEVDGRTVTHLLSVPESEELFIDVGEVIITVPPRAEDRE
ncbi:MAG: fimbrial biogenesis outer membrane usher protein [Deltaproteobacteria bacterium]|nr:fimbrial biogenesis outer membrane usher protein [Deltaproteobacteria bacterium]